MVVGCQTEDRARVAAAKCGLPVTEAVIGAAEDPANAMPRNVDVEVTDLGEGGYRVTGMVLVERPHSAGPRARTWGASFVCEVAPDADDQLRGFRVTKLEADPLRRLK